MYFAIAEVIAGLALPIIISGIAFVVTLGLNSVVNTPVSAVYFMMMVREFPHNATKQCTRLTEVTVLAVYFTADAHPLGASRKGIRAGHDRECPHAL